MFYGLRAIAPRAGSLRNVSRREPRLDRIPVLGLDLLPQQALELLGAGCGTYLIYLGLKAVMTKKDAPPRTVGAHRPLLAGMMFGLTNPKAYPVAVAMFTAIYRSKRERRPIEFPLAAE